MELSRISIFLTSAAMAVVLPSVGLAETAAGPAAGNGPSVLDEVIITVQKRSENVQRAAAAIAVLGAADLEAHGAPNIRELQFMVPGIKIAPQAAFAQMFLRGVGISSDAITLDQGVGLLANGVIQPREAGGSSTLFDVSRIEVLKGPQGTLYGSQAAGGVLNISFNRPSQNYEGSLTAEVGNYNLRHVTAVQNLPLGDKAALRGALNYVAHDGYLSNGLDDQDDITGRLSLSAELSPQVDVLVWAQAYHAGGFGDGFAGVDDFFSKDDPWDQTWNPRGPVLARDPNFASRTRSVDFGFWGAEVNWHLTDHLSLSSVTGYTHTHYRSHTVILAAPPSTLQGGQNFIYRDNYSEELRLSGDYTHFNWLLGAYWFKMDAVQRNSAQGPTLSYDLDSVISESAALFGRFTYSFTPSLRGTLGLRRGRTEKSIDGRVWSSGLAGTPSPVDVGFTWNRTDWKLGLEYDLAADTLLYATVQTGSLPGGINNFKTTPGVSQEIKPEELMDYEVGLKTTLLNGRLRLNTQAYYYDYENYQVGVLDQTINKTIIKNVPKSKIYGLDAEAQYLPTDDDRVSLSLGYIPVAEFTRFVQPQGTISAVRSYDYSGYRMPNAAKITLNASYEHTVRFSSGARLVGSVQSQYSSFAWGGFTHGTARCNTVPAALMTQAQCVDPGTQGPAYTNTSLDLTWHAPNDRFSVGAWVHNAENKAVSNGFADGVLNARGVQLAQPVGSIRPPRTFGLRLGVSW